MTDAASTLEIGAIAMGLFGGIALFLAGMEQMSQALKEVAGEKMSNVLARLTRNRFMAAGTGAFVTAVIQSSSVTTVLVVGFISAGIMNLGQSVGVIMGANIGTTITAQIVAFKVTKYALLLVAVGFGMNFFSDKEKMRQYGAMVMGLGLIFFGMAIMSDATKPLRTFEPFIQLMQNMSNPLLGILVAAAFTALVQSSSATTGIVIVLATQGFITLEAGIALAFGANIGTCVTALLAALGKPRTATQAAMVHVVFNVIGVLLWVPLIAVLADFVRDISPSAPDLAGVARLAAETPRQIANAHTIFNVANTLIFIWFTGTIAALVQKLVPEKPEKMPERAQPVYLDEVYFEAPALALDRVRLELVRLGKGVTEMLDKAVNAVGKGTREDLNEIVSMNDDSTHLYKSMIAYIAKLSQLELSSLQTKQLTQLTAATNTVDNMSDTIATNLVALGQQRLESGAQPSEVTQQAFQPLREAIQESFRKAIESVRDRDGQMAAEVIEMKDQVQELARGLEAHLAKRVAVDEPNRVLVYGLETDSVEILQRLYYFAKRLAKAVVAETAAEEQKGDFPATP
ncbi:MAG: Na/Pi cotransporter family protein [Woeseiaceae bacterium]|nr:Na/Pi cotransporter family protein [Woeseiaceae bacterium]